MKNAEMNHVPIRTMFRRSGFLWLLSLALLAGCADDSPPLGSVSGTLTLDGKPFSGGSLMFTPEGGGRPSVAVTDENGEFEALYLQNTAGALLGTHSVTFEPVGEKADVPEEEQFMPPTGARKGPKSYKISPATIEVKSGSNQLDFTLST